MVPLNIRLISGRKVDHKAEHPLVHHQRAAIHSFRLLILNYCPNDTQTLKLVLYANIVSTTYDITKQQLTPLRVHPARVPLTRIQEYLFFEAVQATLILLCGKPNEGIGDEWFTLSGIGILRNESQLDVFPSL